MSKTFFEHENRSYPFSKLDKLRKPINKSDAVYCILKSYGVSEMTVNEHSVTCTIIDGIALVHMLIPQSSRTFQLYCDQIVGP